MNKSNQGKREKTENKQKTTTTYIAALTWNIKIFLKIS
jgi:hypothetical protein